MSFTVEEFMTIMEELAPAALAEDWDSIGLQAGSRRDQLDSVLVALNVDDAVIDEALAHGCQLILTHHPLIFSPLSSVSDDEPAGRLAGRALREGLAVFAAHTNLDAAPGGLADQLAGIIGLLRVRPLKPAPAPWSKLATFVPPDAIEGVRAALFAAGGGRIGDYEHCSWITGGTGTFRALPGAVPVAGQVGREETVDELRLELVFPAARAAALVEALMEAHPYEEPAYDIYPLATLKRQAGQGRVGDLGESLELESLAGELAELFGLPGLRYAGSPDLVVRRGAVVPGSGADLIGSCTDADVLISGDFRYHHSQAAPASGLALIEIPHEVSEGTALKHWAAVLREALKEKGVKVVDSGAETGFWRQAPPRRKDEVLAAEEAELISLHVDGGARGNPGPAGIGAVLAAPGGRVIETMASFIGNATNNIAEYQALIAGVEMALDRDIRQLAIFSDSELIVRQIQGSYRVKNEGLKPFYEQAKAALARLERYELKSIPREANHHADSLVNKALDEAGH